METFIANETLLIIEGEIYLLDINDRAGLDIKGIPYPVIASTKSLEIVKQLPREVFVKQNKITNAYENIPDNIKKYINYVSFEAGYNANKNDFTLKQLKEAIRMAFISGSESLYTMPEIIDKIQPISLPKSITTNDELEIIKIEW